MKIRQTILLITLAIIGSLRIDGQEVLKPQALRQFYNPPVYISHLPAK